MTLREIMDMEITLKHGAKTFKLTPLTAQDQKYTFNGKGFSSAQVTDLLEHAKPHSHQSWALLWKAIKPAGLRDPDSDEALKKALHKLVCTTKQVQLEEVSPTRPGTSSMSSGNTGGAPGGNSGAGNPRETTNSIHHQGSARTDKAVTTPPKTHTSPNDSNATISDTPSEQGLSSEECQVEGEPISMITGEELLSLEDITLPGPLPFTWRRTYRSSHARNLGLGVGWTHAGCEYLELKNHKLLYVDDEGREIFFNVPDIKQRSKYLPEGLRLDRISSNTFILKQRGRDDRVFTRGNATLNRFRLVQIRHQAFRPELSQSGATDTQAGFVIQFHYDAHARLTRINGNWGKAFHLVRDKHGLIKRIDLVNTRLDQTKTVMAYDYDQKQDLIAYRNAKGVGERYVYDNHLIVKRTLKTGFNYYWKWNGNDPSAKCAHVWGDRGIYSYLFDWYPETNQSQATDSRGYTKSYTYNDYGQIIREVDNEGGVHQFKYHNGSKTEYQDPEGNCTHYLYDLDNNPAGVRDALDNRVSLNYFNNRVTSVLDKDGAYWLRKYNSRGLVSETIDPFKQSTQYRYNAQGMIASITDPLRNSTKYTWSPDGELRSITTPLGIRRQLTYDEWGQVVSAETFDRDGKSLGRVHFQYGPTGLIDKIVDAKGDTTTYGYNDNDQLVSHSDPRGRLTEYVYDGLSQVIERIDPEGQRLRYEYDTERNLTALINENGERYTFEYDGNERLIKEVGFDGRVQTYHYDKAGRLIRQTDAGEVLTEFERDPVGRMTAKTVSSLIDPSVSKEFERFQYDAKGRLTETYNAAQYLVFEHNLLGNVTKEHHSDLNARMNRVKSSMVDIQFSHIWPGVCNQIHLPDGQTLGYEFDRHLRLSEVLRNQTSVTKIDRDEFGREVARNQGALTTASEYDPAGRLIKQTSFNQQQKAQGPIQREYGYDVDGNLSKLSDGPQEVHYVYDMVDRLTRVEGQHPESFTFDPASTLLGVDGSPLGKSEGNRLLMQGDKKFTYDARGNLIQENRGKEGQLETRYHYNLQNQLVKVEKDKQTTEYKYDPLGRRIEKRDDFGITRYLWAGDQLTQESRNNIKKTYIYEPASFRPVAMVENDTVYHYHLDHLGTPKEMTDESGQLVWKARYKAYGSVAVKEVDQVENNLRFQGQYFDEETGLHYNRHRYYNPDTGQFTTQDPIGLLGGINNYQYVPNPVGWVDPLGLECKETLKFKGIHPGGKERIQKLAEELDLNEDNYDDLAEFLYNKDSNPRDLMLGFEQKRLQKWSTEKNYHVIGNFNFGRSLANKSFDVVIRLAMERVDTIRWRVQDPKIQAGKLEYPDVTRVKEIWDGKPGSFSEHEFYLLQKNQHLKDKIHKDSKWDPYSKKNKPE